MKLLFDQNLSPQLSKILSGLYACAQHVENVGMGQASDIELWEYARINGYVIVTKDSDFNDISEIHGFPPKVIWIRKGNCSTDMITQSFLKYAPEINSFLEDDRSRVMAIF